MSEFNFTEKDLASINEGKKYKNSDVVNADAINNAIEASGFAQNTAKTANSNANYAKSLAINAPDLTDVDNVGTPSVEIVSAGNGARLKFSNLKGEKGEIGEVSEARLAESQRPQDVKIKKLEDNVASFNAIFADQNLVSFTKDTMEVSVRETADGLPVVDGTVAEVEKISGDTVASKNFVGLKNAKLSGIRSTGKNLFNPALFTNAGFTADSDGVYAGSSGALYAKYQQANGGMLALNASGAVSLSFVGKKSGEPRYAAGFFFKYNDGSESTAVYIESTTYQKYELHSDRTKAVAFIAVGVGYGDEVFIKDFCVKYGDSADYEPYVENTMSLPSVIELGKYDYIENEKLVKQTNEITFTGSEVWSASTLGSGAHYFTYSPTPSGLKGFDDCVNNKFPSRQYSSGVPCVYMAAGDIHVFPNADVGNETITTLEQWQAFLSQENSNGNPFTVAYKTATPTYESIYFSNSYLVTQGGMEAVLDSNKPANAKIDIEYITRVE